MKEKERNEVEVRSKERTLIVWLFALAMIACAAPVAAQEDIGYEIAPPPLKFVAKEEQERLDVVPHAKDRTKLALTFMDGRMTEAEKLNAAAQFDAMFTELGRFAGLLDYTLNFLGKQDQNDKKILDSYKRLEIAIRGHMGRLEIIRRELPIKYEKYVRDLIKNLRKARTRALDPQFSDTVIPEEETP